MLAAAPGRFHGEKLHGNRELVTLGWKEPHFKEFFKFHLTLFHISISTFPWQHHVVLQIPQAMGFFFPSFWLRWSRASVHTHAPPGSENSLCSAREQDSVLRMSFSHFQFIWAHDPSWFYTQLKGCKGTNEMLILTLALQSRFPPPPPHFHCTRTLSHLGTELLISALCWTHLFFQWLQTQELWRQNSQFSLPCMTKNKQHYCSAFCGFMGATRAGKHQHSGQQPWQPQPLDVKMGVSTKQEFIPTWQWVTPFFRMVLQHEVHHQPLEPQAQEGGI